MNAPDKIYVPLTINLLTKRQVLRLDATDVKPISFANENIEYIRKDALLEWAKKEEDELDSGLCSDGFRLALTMLKQKLESL